MDIMILFHLILSFSSISSVPGLGTVKILSMRSVQWEVMYDAILWKREYTVASVEEHHLPFEV